MNLPTEKERQQILDCPDCMKYADSQPFLVEGAASVGIEAGASTGLMIYLVLRKFHDEGHREVEGGGKDE